MFILIIIFYIFIGIVEVAPIVNDKEYKKLFLYSPLFIFSFVISLLLSLGVKVPSPLPYIEKIVIAVIGKG